MKLAKCILKWSMLIIPILILLILSVSQRGNENFTSANVASITISGSIIWILFALASLGIIKLVEKLKRQANEKTR